MLQVLESSMVVPSDETPRRTLWLSNLDLRRDNFHTDLIAVYRRPDSLSADKMKAALGKALVPFYPLAGRLVTGQDGRTAIDCNAGGALFVVAQSIRSLDDFGDFAPSSALRKTLVPSADSADPPCILLMIQLTYFSCGGVTLGCAAHHTAVDGYSFFHFLITWSDLTRGGEGYAAHPEFRPFHDRTLLHARNPPLVSFDHTELASNAPPAASAPAAPPSVSSVLKLSPCQVSLLKEQCGQRYDVSTFEAVISHVWRSVCEARQLPTTSTTRVYFFGDVRQRLSPPLPLTYFGNALCKTLTEGVTAGDVVSKPFGFAAGLIREAKSKLRDEFVRSAIDFVEVDRRGGRWVVPGTDMVAVSWLGLPADAVDFGWGKPDVWGKASMHRPGFVYVARNQDHVGGVIVTVSLEDEETMRRFKKAFLDQKMEQGVI